MSLHLLFITLIFLPLHVPGSLLLIQLPLIARYRNRITIIVMINANGLLTIPTIKSMGARINILSLLGERWGSYLEAGSNAPSKSGRSSSGIKDISYSLTSRRIFLDSYRSYFHIAWSLRRTTHRRESHRQNYMKFL